MNCPRDSGPGGQLSWGIVLGIVVLVGSCHIGKLSRDSGPGGESSSGELS